MLSTALSTQLQVLGGRLVLPGEPRVREGEQLALAEEAGAAAGLSMPQVPPRGLWTFRGQVLLGQLGSQTLC